MDYILRSILDILINAHCNCTYDVVHHAITVDGVDITNHLMAVFEKTNEVKDDLWRDKICAGLGIPKDMLFTKGDKNVKYNFVRDKKPKVYISGKITGLEEKVYKNSFNSAELYLTGLGYDVVNPASYTGEPNWTWTDFMKQDIALLLKCDYIYLLEGWEDSTGAKTEYRLAREIGIKELRLDDNGVVL